MIKKKSIQILLLTAAFLPTLVLAETLLFQGVESTGQGQYAILEANPDGSSLYAINNTATPGVESFKVNGDGTLSTAFSVSTGQAGLEGATSMAFNPDADVVLLGNNVGTGPSPGGTGFGLYAFSLGDEGNAFVELDFLNSNPGSTAEDGLFDDINVTAVGVSPDGNYIYVAGTLIAGGEAVIDVYGGINFLPRSGRVEYSPFVSSARILETDSTALAALDAPVDLAVTEKGLYVISSSATNPGALLYFTRDDNTGRLTFSSVASADTGIPQVDAPVDILLSTIDNKENIFIAASGSNTLIQFEQAESSAAPALKKIYGQLADNGQPDVSGLTGVSRLIMNSQQTILHVASATNSSITSFYVDDGLLVKSSDTAIVAQGRATSSGVTINGIAAVNLLALGSGNEYLYAASSASTSPGLARFTRQSNLSVDVTSVIPDFVQPGRVTPFSVVLSNNGPADAPRFQLLITPSHAVTDVTVDPNSADLASCVLRSESNSPTIFCEGAVLANGAEFSVEVSMRSNRLTTASVLAQAASGNETESTNASDRDSITVGSAKNGSLAIGLWAHLLLLLMYGVRRFNN